MRQAALLIECRNAGVDVGNSIHRNRGRDNSMSLPLLIAPLLLLDAVEVSWFHDGFLVDQEAAEVSFALWR